jgi:hypothetical protein
MKALRKRARQSLGVSGLFLSRPTTVAEFEQFTLLSAEKAFIRA